MSDDLLARAQQAMASVPHRKDDCFLGYEGHACTCDRDARLAAGMVAASTIKRRHVTEREQIVEFDPAGSTYEVFWQVDGYNHKHESLEEAEKCSQDTYEKDFLAAFTAGASRPREGG